MLVNRPLAIALLFLTACISLFFLSPGYNKVSSYAHNNVPAGANGSKKDAYGLFLVSRNESNDDPYYKATRSLIFQLKYNPATKDDKDVVVLVTKRVPKRKVDRLRKDGAVVRVVDEIPIPAGHESEMKSTRYIDMMTKFRFWEQLDYRRIYVMDSDMTLIKPLSFVWQHESAQFQNLIPDGKYDALNAEDKAVGEDTVHRKFENYVLASGLDPIKQDPNNLRFCAGMFLMSPSKAMFDRFMQIRPKPEIYGGLWNTEQNLLNYAFRPHGPMPWKQLPDRAILQFPGFNPLKYDWHSVHKKYWEDKDELGEYGQEMYGKMIGYHIHKEGGEYY